MKSHNIKKTLLTIFAVIVAAVAAHAGEADNLLKKSVAKLKGARSISAQFTITQNGQSASGTLTVSGRKFVMSAGDMSTWYNGKTQWTMSRKAGECNITEPTADELAQVNPLEVLNTYTHYYTAKLLAAPAGFKRVQLTAKKTGNDISTAVVTLNAGTLLPTQITVTLRSGGNTTVKIQKMTFGKALPESTFVYQAAKHPGIEVVDLR